MTVALADDAGGRMMEREVSVGRVSPYELLFGVGGAAERQLTAIRDEAHRAGVTPSRRDQFAALIGVADLLRELVPEIVEPAALDRYLEILHHCYSFWQAGCHLYAFESAAAQSVIESPPDLSRWSIHSLHSAFYIELPRNLFWAAVVEGEPPEPVEGMFVNLESGRPAGEAELLLVFGMRPDRPGFSVAELSADLDFARGLSEPAAFASDIPGADLAGLYSLQRPTEALLLLLRLLWYQDTYPESVEPVQGVRAEAARPSGRGTSTSLDHYRVSRVGRSRG